MILKPRLRHTVYAVGWDDFQTKAGSNVHLCSIGWDDFKTNAGSHLGLNFLLNFLYIVKYK